MKKILACILALMLCAGLPSASAGQTAGMRITLEELSSDAMSDTDRESIPALLNTLKMDIVTADEGVFALSLGGVQVYFTEDTGLLIHLPDQAMDGSAGSDDLMGAALMGENEPGTWYRPTVSGMPVNSALFLAMQPLMMQQMSQSLGLDLSLMSGTELSDSPGGIPDLSLMAGYLQEDMAVIARRIEPQMNAFFSSGPMKTLLAGLSGKASVSLNSSMLNTVIHEARNRLNEALSRLLSESKPAGQTQPASAAEDDLPELLKGLHFSGYYAQLYQGFLGSLREMAAGGGLSSLFGHPNSLPPFSFEASENRLTLSVGRAFLLTADILPSEGDRVIWSGQILTASTQPIDFKLDMGREGATLDMHNEQGGIRASLTYSLPGWSADWTLITLNASTYSLDSEGRLYDINNISGTLYADETTLSLQGSDGDSGFSAAFAIEETRLTADLSSSAHRGYTINPAYHAELDWTEGLTAQMTETTPYGSKSGGRLWILPEDGGVSFGLASIESVGLKDRGETFLQGSYTEEPDGEKLHLNLDGTLIDLELKAPEETLRQAVIDVSQAGQTMLRAAVHIRAVEGLPLPEPHDIQDIDLEQLFGAMGN